MIFIGIDLGGTKIAGALFDKNGNILNEAYTLLEGSKGKEVGGQITELCNTLLQNREIREGEEISIGVSVPGIAYSKTGLVWAPNIPGWDMYPLRDELAGKFPGAKITIESDRTCYILGEALLGAAKGCENAIFLAVGTGIGAGILIDGRILHGTSDIVGATGWMALKPPYTKEYDACGCFESHASGNGIASMAVKKLSAIHGYSGILSGIPAENITAREIFQAYDEDDPIAKEVIEEAVEMWGMAAANFVSLFNPEIIIFGGGVFGPAVKFIDRIYEEALKWAQPLSIKQCRFTASALGSRAGLFGAGSIALKNI